MLVEIICIYVTCIVLEIVNIIKGQQVSAKNMGSSNGFGTQVPSGPVSLLLNQQQFLKPIITLPSGKYSDWIFLTVLENSLSDGINTKNKRKRDH